MKLIMKLIMRIFIIVVMSCGIAMAISGIAMAQESPQKTQWVGVNPLGLLVKIYSGHYGRYLKNGASDIIVPFFYWHPTDDLTILGGGAEYHIYRDGDGIGVFYGGGAQVFRITWDYKTLNLNTRQYETEKITGTTFTPYANVGYRWIWGKHKELTIAPSISLGTTMGEVKSSSGKEAEYGSSEFHWGLSLGLAYMF